MPPRRTGMAAKPVNGRLLLLAPASTCREGCTWVSVLGEVPPPPPPPLVLSGLTPEPLSWSPRTPLSPFGLTLYCATLALSPLRPETARPAPVVLSSMPSTSMVRMTRRDFISWFPLVRLRAGLATRAWTRCLTASSSSAVASGRFARSWSMTGCRSGWRSSCWLIRSLLRTNAPIPDYERRESVPHDLKHRRAGGARCAGRHRGGRPPRAASRSRTTDDSRMMCADARRGLRAALCGRGAGAVRLPRLPDGRPGAGRGPAGRHLRARAAVAQALRPAPRAGQGVALHDRSEPPARPRAAGGGGRAGAGAHGPGRHRRRSAAVRGPGRGPARAPRPVAGGARGDRAAVRRRADGAGDGRGAGGAADHRRGPRVPGAAEAAGGAGWLIPRPSRLNGGPC